MSESIQDHPSPPPTVSLSETPPPPAAASSPRKPEMPGVDPRLRSFVLRTAILVIGCVTVIVAGGAWVVLQAGKTENSQRPAAAASTDSGVTVAPANEAQPNPTLETLGSLTVVHLYQTYLNLGFLADGVEYDTYSDGDAKELLASIADMIDGVDRQLENLSRDGLGPQDRQRLAQVRGLIALLRTQATELRAYWETPEKDATAKKEHETKFHEARKEAWTGIRQLLGAPAK